MLKNLKKNQIIIYVIALMLVTAGYLNYTAEDNTISTSSEPDAVYQENLANIGDAALVNSDVTDEEETTNEISTEDNNEKTANQETQTEENEESEVQTNATNEDDYFAKSKLERETMYSQMIETYQNIVNSSTVSDQQRKIATQEISNINDTKNSIMICENLLGTKGFEKSVIFVNNKSVSVVVEEDKELTKEQVAQIQNVVSREMNVEVKNINITEK